MEIRRDFDNSLELSALFPGFKFSPTDEELICHYLKGKINGSDMGEEVIPEVEICKYEPWDLPAKSIIQSDHEWFFFSPSGRKYPNGSQARRATEIGFWKATGKERSIKSGANVIGTKRTLVFHKGRAPKGERTCWIMHEYCIKGSMDDKPQDTYVICRLRKNLDFSAKNDSPNCESTGRMGLSPVDVGLPSTSQVGGGTECCLTNKKSDINSIYIEPPDSTSESGPRQPNEICSPGFESQINREDSDAKSVEDDCFVDILKDDIVKLDDPSLPEIPLLSPVVVEKLEIESNSMRPVNRLASHMQPVQGTAHRRMKLNVNLAGLNRAEMFVVGDKISSVKVNRHEAQKPIEGLKSKWSFHTCKGWIIFMALVMVVILLVLFLLVLR